MRVFAEPMIRVRKPFQYSGRRRERRRRQGRAEQINPEHEEKPVSPSASETSEAAHGGSELTFSLYSEQQESEEQEKDEAQQGGQEEEGADQQDGALDSGAADDEEEEEGADQLDDGAESQAGRRNADEKFDVFDDDNSAAQLRHLQTAFYDFISRFAEELTKVKLPGAERYDFERLLFWKYERKPLSAYMYSPAKDRVVLILDNSGSMRWWAEHVQLLAEIAHRHGDVEIYIAPNGSISYKVEKGQQVPVSHSRIVKELRGGTVIYVGDYDGANTPIELSWYNFVVWFAPEGRYRYFRSHDWVSYDEKDFKGVFARVFTLNEMIDVMRRISPYGQRWLDYHEHDTFEYY